MKKYPIITLCGSTRFKEDFERVNRELTLAGNIVISVGAFGHAGDVFSDDQKVMLDDIHKRKIDMADEIFVINKNGYIGASTRSEIEYAKNHGKPVNYMEPVCHSWRKFNDGWFDYYYNTATGEQKLHLDADDIEVS